MNVDFVKISPSKNMTVLITNYVAPTHYSQIAHTIMDYEYVNAEQVGFIVAPKNKKSLLRLAMSGGEFCGNAFLGAAAYCRYKGLTTKDRFLLETTGVDSPLECFVETKSSHLFEAKAEMPNDYFIDNMVVQLNDKIISGSTLQMSGITHFITDYWLDKDDFFPIIEKISKEIDNKAIGIIPYKHLKKGNYEIKPFVYVKETGSRFFEQACGSGSLALGVYLSKQTKEKKFNVYQPGGIIKVETGTNNYISTTVRFTCEGFCEINLSQVNE